MKALGVFDVGAGTSLIKLLDQPVHLIGNLVLPLLEILESLRSRQDLALPGMLWLLGYIREVEMCGGSELVGLVFVTRTSMAVNILDDCHSSE